MNAYALATSLWILLLSLPLDKAFAEEITAGRAHLTQECTHRCAGTKDVCKQSAAWIVCKSDNPALLNCMGLKPDTSFCASYKGQAIDLDEEPDDS